MDKNEIIERLERLARYAVHTVGELPFVMSLDDGIAIHEAIDMLKSQSEPHWIPCSKELPKKDGYYYVTNYNGQSANCLFVEGVTDEFWIRYVTAWMPLPKPWEGEQNG